MKHEYICKNCGESVIEIYNDGDPVSGETLCEDCKPVTFFEWLIQAIDTSAESLSHHSSGTPHYNEISVEWQTLNRVLQALKRYAGDFMTDEELDDATMSLTAKLRKMLDEYKAIYE